MATTAAAPKKASLFQLTEDLLALEQLLTESGGELTPEIETWIAQHADQLKSKVDGIAWIIRACEARAAGFKAHAAEVRDQASAVSAKQKTEENKIARIKEYVRFCLGLMGQTKVEGELYSLGIETNGGAAPAPEIAEPFQSDPSKLPAELRRQVFVADLDRIRKVAEANDGQIVVKAEKPGESDVVIARIPPRGTHVRVR